MKTLYLKALSGIIMLALMASCGFQIRGSGDFKFKTLYIQGPNLSLLKNLKKGLRSNSVLVVEDKNDAQIYLELISESAEQRILSLSGGGKVREYELFYRVSYRMKNPKDALWSEVQQIEGRRDFSYDDTQLLAKQFEEQRLTDDMREDAVREMERKLSAFKLSTK